MSEPTPGPSTGGPIPMTVTGGAGGIDATYDDLLTLADLSDDVAVTYGAVTASCHTMLVDPDLLASAVLDPGGVAAFEKALLGALDGGDGLSALALDLGVQAVGLRATVETYRATDAAQAAAIDKLRWSAGMMIGLFPGLAPAVAEAFVVTKLAEHAPEIYQLAKDGKLGEAPWQAWLTEDLGWADNTVGALPGLMPGMSASDVPSGARLIGLLYPDGPVDAVATGTDPAAGPWEFQNLDRPPATIGDLINGLDVRNTSVSSNTPDQIDVRVVTHADGTKAYIVDIPGTKVWDTPGQDTGELSNTLGTNIHAVGGETTARELAIGQALRDAGASSTDPVMLVGHSQGGILAAQAAADTAKGTFDYNVTHVVTAGAPIGRIDIPPDVQVLALENQHDLIPHLDAADNRDRENVTTVTFDKQLNTVGENHSTTRSYLPAAQGLSTSTDPSVTAFTRGAGAFLDPNATGASHQVYTLNRRGGS